MAAFGAEALPPPEEKMFLLSFDSGMISAYCSLLMLEELMEQVKELENSTDDVRPCDYFDFAAGVGAGGINALFIGRLQMTVKEAIASYERLARDVFNRPRHIPFQSRFEVARLEDTLNDIIQTYASSHRSNDAWESVKETSCQTIIIASIIDSTGTRPHIFNTRGKGSTRAPMDSCNRVSSPHDTQSCDPMDMRISILNVAKATLAAPSYLPPVDVGGGISYADGSFSGNNPTLLVMKEIRMSQEQRGKYFDDSHFAMILNFGIGPGGFEDRLSAKTPSRATSTRTGSSVTTLRQSITSRILQWRQDAARGEPTLEKKLSRNVDDEMTKARELDSKPVVDLDDEVARALRLQACKLDLPYYRFDAWHSKDAVNIQSSRWKPFNQKTLKSIYLWIKGYVGEEDVKNRIWKCAKQLVEHRRMKINKLLPLETHPTDDTPSGGPNESTKDFDPKTDRDAQESRQSVPKERPSETGNPESEHRGETSHNAAVERRHSEQQGAYETAPLANLTSSHNTTTDPIFNNVTSLFAWDESPHLSDDADLLSRLPLHSWDRNGAKVMNLLNSKPMPLIISQAGPVVVFMAENLAPVPHNGRSSLRVATSHSTMHNDTMVSSVRQPGSSRSTAPTTYSTLTSGPSGPSAASEGKLEAKSAHYCAEELKERVLQVLQQRPNDWGVLFNTDQCNHMYDRHLKLDKLYKHWIDMLDIPRFGDWSICKRNYIDGQWSWPESVYSPNIAHSTVPFGLRFQRAFKGRLKLFLTNSRVNECPTDYRYVIDDRKTRRRPDAWLH